MLLDLVAAPNAADLRSRDKAPYPVEVDSSAAPSIVLPVAVHHSGVATSGRLGWLVKFCGADTVEYIMPYHAVRACGVGAIEVAAGATVIVLFEIA